MGILSSCKVNQLLHKQEERGKERRLFLIRAQKQFQNKELNGIRFAQQVSLLYLRYI